MGDACVAPTITNSDPPCARPHSNGYNDSKAVKAHKRELERKVSKRQYRVSLIEDIAERDANYIRLLRLLPQLRAWRDLSRRPPPAFNEEIAAAELQSHSFTFLLPGPDETDLTMRIRVTEAFRYTTGLEIVQQPGNPDRLLNPSMQIRVYHDVNSAEVLSYQGQRGFKARYKQPDKRMYQVNEKAQINRFLGEWLTHCLHSGRVRLNRETALQV